MKNSRPSLPLLVLTLALGSCTAPTTKVDPLTVVASPPAAPHFTIDESKLPHIDAITINHLDTTKNACGDLYGYVNGKWLAENPIPPDRTSWGPGQLLVERSLAIQHQIAKQSAADITATGAEKIIGDFYATGMDTTKINAHGAAPIKAQLEEIDQLRNSSDIANYLRISAARGQGLVFDFTYDSDFKDADNTIGYAQQGGLGLPDRGYYFDADKREQLDAYRAHIAKVLTLSGTTKAQARSDAVAVIAFESRLAKASRSSEEMSSDVSIFYNPVTPAAADALTPHFSWSAFFRVQGIAVPPMFSLAMPAFHQEVDHMLADVPVGQWQAYLRFHVVDSASPYLSDPFVQENFGFYSRTLRGQKQMKADWKRVLKTIEDNTGEAMGQLYVSVAFPQRSKREMEVLVGNLRLALKNRLENLTWMSTLTKQKALQKLAAIKPKIGYPDEWRSWNGLATSRDSYYGNVAAAQAFNHRWAMAKIGKPVNRDEWLMTPQTVNAQYNPLRNDITFPAAILQPPAFDPDADPLVNYAAIGAIIGHEMTHGYDNQGSRFGPRGKFETWWTAEDAKKFAARSETLVAQFDAYQAMPGLHVNGKLTLGENIADLGGLNIAYDAMKIATSQTPDPRIDGLTRDQRFFLTFAADWRQQVAPAYQKILLASDPHAPPQFRAIASPSNMPAFAKAFGCNPGDTMWRDPAKMVSIW